MKVVFIGGSAASMTAAAKLRRLQPEWKITVYQKESYISFGACGLPYYLGGHFEDYQRMIARTADDMAKINIDVKTKTTVTSVNHQKKSLIFVDERGHEVEDHFDQLFIGVGAAPIIPAIPGSKAKNVFPFTRLEDAFAIKSKIKNYEKVAIIGSGFIGLEVVEAMGDLKLDTTLVEAAPRLMARVFDEEMTNLIEEELTKQKVDVIKDDSLVEILTKDDQAYEIHLKSGRKIEVDAVVLAIGVRPATDFLKETGIEMAPNGALKVDRHGRTNLANVWSCGDCATSYNRLTKSEDYLALATVARKFAKVVAINMAGKEVEYAGHMQTAIIKIFDLEAARTGLTEIEAEQKGYDYFTVFIEDRDQTDYVANQKPLYLKLIVDKAKRVLIGAQIVGYNKSVIRIDALISLMWANAKIDDQLEQLDLPYAPPFARPIDIINIALTKAAERLEKGKK